MTGANEIHCVEYAQIDRRAFMTRGLGHAGSWILGNRIAALPSWMPRFSLSDPHVGPAGDTLVCVFLRGGADGLNMVIPHGDSAYYRRRPTLGVPRPDDARAGSTTLDLDGFFGFHPALSPLNDIYRAGDLALVHATGSPDETRSHFEAMYLMERGAIKGGDYSGWLSRHLESLDSGNNSSLRAVGIGDILPASLNGSVTATALNSVSDYHLMGNGERAGRMREILKALYDRDQTMLRSAAYGTFEAMDLLDRVEKDSLTLNGPDYPDRDIGRGFRVAAQLIRADVGVEVACIDMGGWDTHVTQGSTDGAMAQLMAELAQSLLAFYEELQAKMDGITILVMSEFGRRVQENAGLGTDHGHGNMMMVMGGGINGGRVYTQWPGLQDDQLVGPGDLAITTDYRQVLAEIIRKRLNNPQLDHIFPGYIVEELRLAQPRSG